LRDRRRCLAAATFLRKIHSQRPILQLHLLELSLEISYKDLVMFQRLDRARKLKSVLYRDQGVTYLPIFVFASTSTKFNDGAFRGRFRAGIVGGVRLGIFRIRVHRDL
jgi:hypothetical protein